MFSVNPFLLLEEVVKYFIIFGINITGKGLFCFRMKTLQIGSLHAVIYDKCLLSKRCTRYWSLKIWGMRRHRFYTNSDCVTLEDKIRSIYNNEFYCIK